MGRFRSSLAVLVLAGSLFTAGTVFALAEPAVEELPQGIAAQVSEAPVGVGTITVRELRRAIVQTSFQAGVSPAPGPGEPRVRRFAARALGDLLEAAYLEGEAVERGISVTGTEVAREKAAIKRSSFRSEADYREFLRESKLSERDVNQRVRLMILSRRIYGDVVRGVRGGAALRAALKAFIAEYNQRWRPRTVCAPKYAIVRCSNVPLRSSG